MKKEVHVLLYVKSPVSGRRLPVGKPERFALYLILFHDSCTAHLRLIRNGSIAKPAGAL